MILVQRFENANDAKEAIYQMDGRRVFGGGDALSVELAGKPSRRERSRERRRDGSRDRSYGSPQGNCYNCNRPGHM